MRVIRPNYSKEHICYYCGKNKANPNKEVSRILTKIVGKGFPLAVSYIQVDVRVPRCEKCEKHHNFAEKPSYFLFIGGCILAILFPILFVIYSILFKAEDFNFSSLLSNWYVILIYFFLFLLMWAVICYVLGGIIRVVINAFMKGVKDEYDDDFYPPVKKLLDIGFIKQKPDAAAQYGKTIDNDKQKLQNTLNSIIIEDNCFISSK